MAGTPLMHVVVDGFTLAKFADLINPTELHQSDWRLAAQEGILSVSVFAEISVINNTSLCFRMGYFIRSMSW
jgi:hypothetical protein